jgi:hypothetical protein
VAPTLPLAAHHHPMRPDANLSLPGISQLVAEFLDRLDLRDITLVGNDTGGAPNCSPATTRPGSGGSFSPPATRSTTSRQVSPAERWC